ncbi:hypothetical protein MUK42_02272 [Musa troglodytarum]|uniref:Hexokinase N-terminal domain-containing protein n=1 Tax=Musa troglodytarum TaxID=320322 RepID=A0A9E7ET28_9LILI|nr:hypothetical protein MUK42_02272 [Musa troglodytarum]
MVVEMHAGLASDGGSKLQMLLAFVDTLPGGNEDGVYCALDLRGTSCRVLKVQLGGSGPKIINHKVEQQQILKELVSSTSEVLLHFIALTLKEFIEREENGQAPGVLIKWTKGFTIEDVVGKDVSQCLEEAMWENGLHMQVAALTSGLSLKAKMIVVRVCDIVTRGAARLAAAGIIDWAQIVLNPIQLVAGNALLVHAYCTAAVAFSVTFLFSLGPAIAGLHRRWWPVGRYPLGGWEGGGARSRGGQSEEDCATPARKLRQVVDAMVVEMHAGLASDGGSKLQMLLAFVDTLPGGNEDGVYCALDLRGTSCRVLKVQLGGSGPKIINHKVEQQQILKELVSSTSEVLLHFIALTLKEFIEREENGQAPGSKKELGFTFSFPIRQLSVSSGVLIKWTKGFTIEDVVGKDVSQCLEEAMWENGLHMQVAALTSGLSLKAKMIVVRVCDIVTRGAARTSFFWIPAEINIPASYPKCSPVLLDELPDEQRESEDLSIKARSRFDNSLRGLSQPVSLGELARTWDACAHKILVEYAQQTGGGTFSTTYGTWENVREREISGWEGWGARSRVGQFEEDCATPVWKLRQVVDAMVVEMHAGLASDGGSKLQMLLAFVDTLPGGNEDGVYCALDLRGTSCRVLKVQLGGSGPKIINHKVEQQQILKELVSSTSEVLLHFIALTLKEFIEREENGQAPGSKKELGFTFSFPIRQLSVSSGVLIKWTKGFTIEDVVGKDVSQCLEEAMWENGLHMQVAALV